MEMPIWGFPFFMPNQVLDKAPEKIFKGNANDNERVTYKCVT